MRNEPRWPPRGLDGVKRGSSSPTTPQSIAQAHPSPARTGSTNPGTTAPTLLGRGTGIDAWGTSQQQLLKKHKMV